MLLIHEITTLYARLLGAVLTQRREREARLMTGDAVSVSIAFRFAVPSSKQTKAGYRISIHLAGQQPNVRP